MGLSEVHIMNFERREKEVVRPASEPPHVSAADLRLVRGELEGIFARHMPMENRERLRSMADGIVRLLMAQGTLQYPDVISMLSDLNIDRDVAESLAESIAGSAPAAA